MGEDYHRFGGPVRRGSFADHNQQFPDAGEDDSPQTADEIIAELEKALNEYESFSDLVKVVRRIVTEYKIKKELPDF